MIRERHKHILILRFSAFGDLAILYPLLKMKMEARPDIDVSLAGPARLEMLFKGIPRLNYIAVDKHSGIRNIFRTVSSCHPTVIADIHSVLRTYILDLLFLLHFKPVHLHGKQRLSRWRLSRQKHKVRSQLMCAWQRYDIVLSRAGLDTPVSMPPAIAPKKSDDAVRRVGIAPFASSYGKSWPVENMEQVVSELSSDGNIRLVFFGGPGYADFFDGLTRRYPNSMSTCRLSFQEEMEAMKGLDVMVSMDSANMHFASCFDVPCVSIWAASHPYYGFYGWRQKPEWAMIPDLECQPCHVFGKKKCPFGTYACRTAVTPEMVTEKIRSILNGRS